jgi:hypothetical protein
MARFPFMIILLLASTSLAAEVRIDCSGVEGRIRPLHGVNNGPLNFGDTIDVSRYWREVNIPLTRLHDSEWPRPDIVDITAVFPNLKADAESPASYQFKLTDDYIQSILDTGSGIVYRLGESIEHTKRKYRVNPPADYDQWVAACIGIIRHYNHGWADGYKHNIQYWELWNEPENQPAMWTGSNEQFYRLYSTAAKAIKKEFPTLKIGGPSAGGTGKVVDGRFVPIGFLDGFIDQVRKTEAPLDFFSWHTYTNDPFIYRKKAVAIRRWLDEHGFSKAEMHLNEWNYLPDNDWSGMGREATPQSKEKWYDRMGGPEGAAFVACVLSDLQDSPVDVANMFTGDTNPFGLFSRYGVPRKTFFAFKAFRMLLDTPQRIKVELDAAGEGTTVLAGVNKDRNAVTVMISNYRGANAEVKVHLDALPWDGAGKWTVFLLDEKNSLTAAESGKAETKELRLSRRLPAPSVMVLRVERGR